jgi:hypothetical protein
VILAYEFELFRGANLCIWLTAVRGAFGLSLWGWQSFAGALPPLCSYGHGLTHRLIKTISIGSWIDGFQEFVSDQPLFGIVADRNLSPFQRCPHMLSPQQSNNLKRFAQYLSPISVATRTHNLCLDCAHMNNPRCARAGQKGAPEA